MPEPTAPTPKPLGEIITPVPGPWKKLAISAGKFIFVVVMGAIGQFLKENQTEILQLALTVLPTYAQGYLGSLIGAGLGGAIVWFQTRAKSNERQKVLDAIVSDPPANLDKYYKQ